ncbi:guanosine-3',5'-bis(diphosphate) 3'-pyrophosphohydrolase [Pasteurellaceae bacterium RH1A]|nr:guanosine-3',5'-bis(diphosphate) 3'-pyrophosphohydrolase [Pasteurellaceae bacterium RH1A]
MLLSQKAAQFAQQAHQNQLDKAGQPYIYHLKFVADLLSHEDDIVIATAWLHDSVEDTQMSLGEISVLFGQAIAKAVEAITKRKGESYQDYLGRVKANEIARKVKIADLTHNMDLSRLPNPTEKDRLRQQKYQQAKHFLLT